MSTDTEAAAGESCPIFEVSGHGIAVKKGGRLFEPDPGRKDVFFRGPSGGGVTITVPVEEAYTRYANGKRFRLVPAEQPDPDPARERKE